MVAIDPRALLYGVTTMHAVTSTVLPRSNQAAELKAYEHVAIAADMNPPCSPDHPHGPRCDDYEGYGSPCEEHESEFVCVDSTPEKCHQPPEECHQPEKCHQPPEKCHQPPEKCHQPPEKCHQPPEKRRNFARYPPEPDATSIEDFQPAGTATVLDAGPAGTTGDFPELESTSIEDYQATSTMPSRTVSNPPQTTQPPDYEEADPDTPSQKPTYTPPKPAYEEADPPAEQPDTPQPDYEQPASTYQAPQPTYGPPPPDYEQPDPNYEQPDPNYKQQDPNYKQPEQKYGPRPPEQSYEPPPPEQNYEPSPPEQNYGPPPPEQNYGPPPPDCQSCEGDEYSPKPDCQRCESSKPECESCGEKGYSPRPECESCGEKPGECESCGEKPGECESCGKNKGECESCGKHNGGECQGKLNKPGKLWRLRTHVVEGAGNDEFENLYVQKTEDGAPNSVPKLSCERETAGKFFYDGSTSSVNMWQGQCNFSGLVMYGDNDADAYSPAFISESVGTHRMRAGWGSIWWDNDRFDGWVVCKCRDGAQGYELQWQDAIGNQGIDENRCAKVELLTENC